MKRMLILNQAGDELYILSQTVLIRVMGVKINGVEKWCVNIFMAGENTYNTIGIYLTEEKAKAAMNYLFLNFRDGVKALQMPSNTDGD